MTTWTVPATIVRVVDGDTLEVDLDLGWRITYHAKVRLAGVNCPELRTDAGVQARNFTSRWTMGIDDSDWWGIEQPHVPITVVSRSLDKYGRVLGDVYRTDPNAPVRHLNAAILAAGHGVVAK